MLIRKLPLLLIPLLSILISCDEGSLNPNTPPDTQLFIDNINLEGENRLNSIVRLRWSGEDKDGYVVAYEISQDNTNWDLVTVQDSTFQFPIPDGQSSTDISFYVRAIDNLGLLDPSPASLLIPIKNTPPIASFDQTKGIPDTAFVVFSVLWNTDDLDGIETLDSVYLKVNDGEWASFSPANNFISIIPERPTEEGIQNGKVFSGSNISTPSNILTGLRVEGDNQLYIRASDVTGTSSEIDSSKIFYLKSRKSELLVLDSYGSSTADDVYLPLLQKVFPGFDYRDIIANTPVFWDPTFGLYIQQYDKIFWYSDDAEPQDIGTQLYLEIASSSLQIFLNNGGKLMVSTKFSNTFTDPESNQSTIYGFSPIDSFSTSVGQARIAVDSLAFPVASAVGEFPSLVVDRFITGADPFYPKNPEEQLYQAQITPSRGWIGPSTVAAKTSFTNGETNQVFFSIELHKFNKEPLALEALFRKVLLEEFDW